MQNTGGEFGWKNIFEVEKRVGIRTKKIAKNNGTSKTQGSNFTEEKVGENKENEIRVLRNVIESLENQKQNVEELINKRDRKLHIWIQRKDN